MLGSEPEKSYFEVKLIKFYEVLLLEIRKINLLCRKLEDRNCLPRLKRRFGNIVIKNQLFNAKNSI